MLDVLRKFWMGAWRISLVSFAAIVILYVGFAIHEVFPNALMILFAASLFCFGAYTIGNLILEDRAYKRKLAEIDRQWAEEMKRLNEKVNNDPKS